MNAKILVLLLHLVLCSACVSNAQVRREPSKVVNAARPCRPNRDSLYVRAEVLNELANILNHSIPEYSRANKKGFYSDWESGIGFFVVDLTKPSNKYVKLEDCVDFIDGHVYHVAPLQSEYSLSHIVIQEHGSLTVFRSINCPDRGERLEDAISYVNLKFKHDKKRLGIIDRMRHYKRYGYYYSMNHVSFLCRHGN